MKYRKKPVVIEAIEYTGGNFIELDKFVNNKKIILWSHTYDNKLTISTLEGEMIASEGDFIIQGVNGEFYPCKPDIFEKTYEKVEGVNNNV